MTYKICAFCRFWQSERAENNLSTAAQAAESGQAEGAGGEPPAERHAEPQPAEPAGRGRRGG